MACALLLWAGMARSAELVTMALWAALGVHCGGQQSSAEGPSTTSEPSAPSEPKVTDMHRHFDDVNQIQQALISGDLSAARSLATQLRVGFSGTTPPGWQSYVERTVASAEMMEATTNIEMAARIAGTMAGTCGACHRSQGMEVLRDDGGEVSTDDVMRRHRWASERLWDGLIGPSDAAWQAGATILGESTFSVEAVEGFVEITPEVEALIAQLQSASQRAQSTTDAQERQTLYGELLAGCAGCHSQMLSQRD